MHANTIDLTQFNFYCHRTFSKSANKNGKPPDEPDSEGSMRRKISEKATEKIELKR